MPHFTLEYSANLDARVDMGELCETIRQVALTTGMFEIGGIRVRAVRCEAYAIADANPDNAFLDLTIKVGEGRSVEAQKAAGETIFARLQEYLAPLFESPHFALSMQIREMASATSWKKNSMHARLREG